MPVHFFDSIANEFSHESWVSGMSIYHSGGVRKFENYEDLTQAEIRAGLGEYFKVHLKFHGEGRTIQWMDCTCKDNRRRGTRCAHLAALCIHIDSDEEKFLKSHGFTGGTAEERITQISNRISRDSISNMLNLEDDNDLDPSITEASSNAARTTSANAKQNALQSEIWSKPELGQENIPANTSGLRLPVGISLRKVSHAKEPGVLIATMSRSDNKELKYRLGVEDSLAILAWPGAREALSERLVAELARGLSAHRAFRISRPRAGVFQIEKRVLVISSQSTLESHASEQPQLDNPLDEIAWENISRLQTGRSGIFFKKFGFLRFQDALDPSREARWNDYPSQAKIDSEVAAQLFQSDFERLRQTATVIVNPELQGLRVTTNLQVSAIQVAQGRDGSFEVRTTLASKVPTVSVDTEHSSADLQSTQPALSLNESGVSLLEIISARKQGRSFIETKDGWVRVSDEFDWVAQKLDAKGNVHLSKLELIRFKESLIGDRNVSAQGDVVKRLFSGLVSQKDIKTPELSDTSLSLRPYQFEGFQWLWWLYENRLGGLLADEMGLGKTHQAMALLSAIGRNNESSAPSLVVCPTTVIDHWKDKINQFAPNIEVFCYYGSSRPSIPNNRKYFVALTSYGILLRDIDLIAAREWSAVILDEAHLVKNQTTRTYQAACKIRSATRICLTGTPLENDLFELKTLFDYIVPGYLGPDTAFRKRYITPSPEAASNPLAAIELKRLVHPFKLRRIKTEVLRDLPEKVEDIRYCNMTKQQRELYEQALKLKGQPILEAMASLDGPVPYVHVFAVITFLKQICNDPGLVHPDYDSISSGKIELLDEILGEALESDQKVVIFSQYARMVNRLSAHLDKLGIRHVTLTGQSNKRGSIISDFQNDPSIKVFIGSLLAGGTGIDLTAANVVIHFDRWWNAAKENQATDRIHRIGQQRNVQVFKLVTRGTLEEHIDKIIEKKRITFEKYIEDDPQAFKNITRDDLIKLLTPPTATTFDESSATEGEAGNTDLRHGAEVTFAGENLDFLTIDPELD
jgi:superfamily II DNA or RNA helicase